MIPDTFNAFYVDEDHQASIKSVPYSELPDHEVTIRVHYSSLNYKDALSSRGLNRVTKSYPHIPGIDAAGVVLNDQSGTFEEGQEVIVTGNDLGTNTFGGFGELIRVPASWVVKLPNGLSLEQSMSIGTAGFTALYGIERLKTESIELDGGPVLVTGATGGVGSFAVFSLSQLGYKVIAASTKSEANELLTVLGANEIINSKDLIEAPSRPLLPRKWNGCIETVGGKLLDAVLRQTYPKGAVACCGNVLGVQLQTNVLPFILRGISLLGIDSAFCIRSIREQIWETAAQLPLDTLPDNYYRVVPLEQLSSEIDAILDGKQVGRIVVKHSEP